MLTFLKTKKTSRPGNGCKIDSHLQEIFFIFLSRSLRARCQSFAKSADAGLESVKKSCKEVNTQKVKEAVNFLHAVESQKRHFPSSFC
jgi:hypothetical protein